MQGKTYTADPLSHKRYKNLGEADQFYVSEHHEPIISPEKFDMVQEILKERCGARANGRRIGKTGLLGRSKPEREKMKTGSTMSLGSDIALPVFWTAKNNVVTHRC